MPPIKTTNIAPAQSTHDTLTPQHPHLTFLQHLYTYQIPQNATTNTQFLHNLFATAQKYHVPPLKAKILAYFTPSLDTAWGTEAFIDLVVKLYEPELEEPLYDLRVRVADYVARRMGGLDDAVRGLLDGMPDFGEDVFAALKEWGEGGLEGDRVDEMEG